MINSIQHHSNHNSITKQLSHLIKNHRIILIVFTIHILVWGIIDQFISPHPDYIDHWMQSRVFSLSYYEHPPMVAWFIKLFSSIFGTSEGGFEAAALCANLLIICLAYTITIALYGKRAGIFTLLCLESTPFFMAKSASIQTEQPLLIFWMLAIFAIIKYQQSDKFYWVILTAIFAGCGALSKYTMIFFYASLFVYFTLVKSRRHEWLNPRQYVGGLVALLVFSPVLIWNSMNDWVSFRFQLAKSGGADDLLLGYTTLFFLSMTILLYSCVLIVWGGWLMVQRVKTGALKNKNGELSDSPELLLIVFTIIPLLIFSLLLLKSDYFDPQWAVISVVSFFIWLGGRSSELWEEGKIALLRSIYSLAFIVNFIFFAILLLHLYKPLMEIETTKDPINRITGWDKMGDKVEHYLENKGIPQPDYVIAMGYTLAAQFALHLHSHPKSYSIARIRRNLWSDPFKMNRDNTILVCDQVVECQRLENRVSLATGFIIKKETVFHLTFRGQQRFLNLYRITGKDFNLLDDEWRDHRLPFSPQ